MLRSELFSLDRATARQQIDDQHDERHNEQQVNQTAADTTDGTD